MMQLTLYTTAGCHLCELAKAMLIRLQTEPIYSVDEIEIGDDDNLVEQYGIRIPVILFPDNSTLNWPFTEQDIVEKLSKIKN